VLTARLASSLVLIRSRPCDVQLLWEEPAAVICFGIVVAEASARSRVHSGDSSLKWTRDSDYISFIRGYSMTL
jgi:hypothetical protein